MILTSASRMLAVDLGLLLLRLMIAAVGIGHGGQKLFGLFHGDGHEAFAKILESLNVPMPGISAWLVGLVEFCCGALIGAGFLTRVAAIPFAINMAVAILLVHKGHFFAPAGMEFPLTLAVIAVTIFLAGPGRLSLDSAFLGRVPSNP
jgi:putative oxidoreductase